MLVLIITSGNSRSVCLNCLKNQPSYFIRLIYQSSFNFLIWYTWKKIMKKTHLSCSPHTTNQYESRIFATNFCLLTLLVNIGKVKVLNWDKNTSKNANISLYTQKIKTLCNTLNWGNWNSGFVKLVVRWAERDIGVIKV